MLDLFYLLIFPLISLPKFPECYGRSGRDVEGIDLVGHGDAHDEVGMADYFVRESFALGAHDNGELLLLTKDGCVDRYGAVAKRHGGCLKSELA